MGLGKISDLLKSGYYRGSFIFTEMKGGFLNEKSSLFSAVA